MHSHKTVHLDCQQPVDAQTTVSCLLSRELLAVEMEMEGNGGGGRCAHVALITCPGMGHLIPMAELAKQLVLRHHLTATLMLFPFFVDIQKPLLDSLPRGLSYIVLPDAPIDDLPADARVETRIHTTVSRSVHAVHDILRGLKSTTHLAAFVLDGFCIDTITAARELGVPDYVFCTGPFMTLALILHLPTLDETTSCEFRDLPHPVQLPGCVPLRGADLLDPIQDRTNPIYQWFLRVSRSFREVKAVLVNSFIDMEPGASRALMSGTGAPPVYPVGPLVRPSSPTDEECIDWLEEQPPGSVLFVSFGSGGTLSSEQTAELALGLEMSGQRFLWVVRCPSDTDTSAAFFDVDGSTDPLAFLPKGFVERTKGFGLAVPSWAPQRQVLGHEATGGFMTHCGWNSTLESVISGVPMIVWPLFAEQKMNAVMLVEDLKVALRPGDGGGGVVGRGEVSKVVRELMEGEGGKGARDRIRKLQKAAAEAQMEEGSSHMALDRITAQWKESIA